jgi:hypothetical protein
MDRVGRATLAGLVLICAATSQVEAAPPTVTPSPGYDARLQEQRAASGMSAPVTVAPVRSVHPRRHGKRVRDR